MAISAAKWGRLDNIEFMQIGAGEGFTSEVFGLFKPGTEPDPSGVYRSLPVFVKSIKLTPDGWEETDEPYTITAPIKLERVIKSRKRFIIVIGGRGSGKSNTVVDICADKMERSAKCGFFREFQNSIEDSTHPLIADEVERLGLKGFRVGKKEIGHNSGGLARFKGLARNPESIKGWAGFDVFATDEAQTISEKSLKNLTPTMRKDGGVMFFTANPGSSADPFSVRFITPYLNKMIDGIYEDDLHLIVMLNHADNPFFPKSLEDERNFDKGYLSAAMYDHVWEGAYNDTVEDAIIPAAWFDAAIDAHRVIGFEATGARSGALDPADVGNDNKAYIERHGPIVVNALSWYEGDANDAGDRAIAEVTANNVELFAWDVSGLGAGLRRQLTEGMKGRTVAAYNGGEGVANPDQPVEMDNWLNKGKETTGDNVKTAKDLFFNRRAQDAYYLRRRLEKTFLARRAVEAGGENPYHPDELLSIDSEAIPQDVITRMRSEVCRVPRVYNNAGKFQVMPKPQMKQKLKIPSPGLFDCLLMLEQPPEPDWTPRDYSDSLPGSNY